MQFLLGLFPFDAQDVWTSLAAYRIGTKDGFTVFPTITKSGKVCKAKLIKFNTETGKRIKDGYSTSSLEYCLKKEGKIQSEFFTDKEVFFGEHLLSKYPDLPIAIVESEKSAVIGSICDGVFPEMVWLACGSGDWLKTERLLRLGRNRTIWLFPDADTNGRWFSKWQRVASDARLHGLSVNVSDLIENRATDAERASGADLADYLICLQLERNDPANREAFRDGIEERLAILTIDGGLTQEQAEAQITATGFYQDAIQSALESVR